MVNIVEKLSEPLLPLIDYDAPSALRRYLDEHGLGMQKKFGQNYFKTNNLIEQCKTFTEDATRMAMSLVGERSGQ
jgi:hypothetical protein